jgi:hypothetical protein
MMRIVIKGVGRPVGWLRRVTLWTGVAGLAVVGTGGAALASDAATPATPATPATQIQACYPTANNPAPLEVLHVAGSHCASGFSALTWNITGPLGIPGPTGATGSQGVPGPRGPAGPPGPGGSATGVTAAVADTSDPGPVFRSSPAGYTVLTSPPVQDTGTYYLSASLTFQVTGGDIVGCDFEPTSAESGDQEIEAPTVTEFENMSMTGAISLNAGQEVTVLCDNLAESTSVTSFSEGDLNAVLITNSGPVGSANSTHSPLKIVKPS